MLQGITNELQENRLSISQEQTLFFTKVFNNLSKSYYMNLTNRMYLKVFLNPIRYSQRSAKFQKHRILKILTLIFLSIYHRDYHLFPFSFHLPNKSDKKNHIYNVSKILMGHTFRSDPISLLEPPQTNRIVVKAS